MWVSLSVTAIKYSTIAQGEPANNESGKKAIYTHPLTYSEALEIANDYNQKRNDDSAHDGSRKKI
jgi:hypothetical protein